MRARRLRSRALWQSLNGYDGHHLTRAQRLGRWRYLMRARRFPGGR